MWFSRAGWESAEFRSWWLMPIPNKTNLDRPRTSIDIRPTGLTSAEFVQRAREEAKLVFQPGTIGGGAGEGFIRGALTKASPEFDEGLNRFTRFVRGLL